ncbi:MAG: MOSC N-terminal beta barrel domain-containing protein [Chloroflexi bacterium]|nr:MOSC N-terminal beta barrel domain-containing protein [Chloroflexota bacterium]
MHYYPVKSCGGASLQEAEVGPRGIAHDREFMVVDATGLFRTQRKDPRMALVRPSLGKEALSLSAPGMRDLTVPILREGERRRVTVWRDACDAIDQGDEASAWFSDFLRKPSRLVRMADDWVRKVNPRYAHSERDQVGFVDGYPFLLLSTEDLDDLNARLLQQGHGPLPMNRFRPSIVVSGAGIPYAEDEWDEILIGQVPCKVVKPCERCAITMTDQATAQREKEPMRTLLRYRPIRPGRGLPYFGQNLVHAATGMLRIGDPVTLR